jgi:hypothetical protein
MMILFVLCDVEVQDISATARPTMIGLKYFYAVLALWNSKLLLGGRHWNAIVLLTEMFDFISDLAN